MAAPHYPVYPVDGRRSPPSGCLPRWEDRYQAVAAQADEGIFFFDASTKHLLDANEAFCQLLGYRAGDIPRLTLHDIIAHDPASISAPGWRRSESSTTGVASLRPRSSANSLPAATSAWSG